MIKKKSKFLTFLFAFWPGAGHMYMGFMKMGISLMGIFMGLIAISSWLNMSSIIFFLPLVWCYAFFDALNKSSLSDEEFYSLQDNYCISTQSIYQLKQIFNGKERQIFAIVLILIGVDILWQNLSWIFQWIIPRWIRIHIGGLIYHIPQILIACLILYIGVHLIYHKKIELSIEEKKQSEEKK